jgi:hypothetical protein
LEGGFEYRPIEGWRENLYLRFGTLNILEILRPFTDKNAPANGLEWTFLYLKRSFDDEESCGLIPIVQGSAILTTSGVLEL